MHDSQSSNRSALEDVARQDNTPPVAFRSWFGSCLLLGALLLVAAIYWPGLQGGWLFDDYPNIVDNKAVQPNQTTITTLLNAALSSPASEFKRPLASLTFAANYLVTGLDPYWMKLTNLLIHLLNGALVFLLVRALLDYQTTAPARPHHQAIRQIEKGALDNRSFTPPPTSMPLALLVATAWMLLPINLTAVLYVVQRMETIANIFVLMGLIGYIHGRRLMLSESHSQSNKTGLLICSTSIALSTVIGVTAKETAAMLPLYAFLVECCVFRFCRHSTHPADSSSQGTDTRIVVLFLLVLALPLLAGLAYLLPQISRPDAWSTRNFTMQTRLLSEARVVVDYIGWTLAPTPQTLSFYHDDFTVSVGLLEPSTTLSSIACIVLLLVAMTTLRNRQALASLGLALFFGSHLLTGTILPLELIYEHRNYFASLGLLLTISSLLAPYVTGDRLRLERRVGSRTNTVYVPTRIAILVLTASTVSWWAWQTSSTAYAWGEPLRLAKELAARDPESPRAQYELGRTYITYSKYNPSSPYVPLAYAALEKAAALPSSSVLPEQALLFMNARMHLPLKEEWWRSMLAKLVARKPGVQDESALIALMHCRGEGQCNFLASNLDAAFSAAMSHDTPSARLMASYGEYAWVQLGNRTLGIQLIAEAVSKAPGETAYRITWIRMLLDMHRTVEAAQQLDQLRRMNTAGRLQNSIDKLQQLVDEN